MESLGSQLRSDEKQAELFRVKICGVRTAEDALAAADAGADAIGLNFYRGSRRSIEVSAAAEVAAAVTGRLHLVGVFVDETPAAVAEVASRLPLHYIQLHGSEEWTEQDLRGLPPVVRALRWPALDLAQARFIGRWTLPPLADRVVGYLADANVAGALGGTGMTTRWETLHPRPEPLRRRPLILAGGLTAANVGRAIERVRPASVDTAGGVEDSSGRQHPQRIHDFVAAAREAFQKLDSHR